MKKVVLIYPRFGFSFAGRPPLSILTLAAYLEKKGVPVSVIDINHEDNWQKKILEEATKASCLGISAMTGNQIKDGLEITNFVKERFPHLPIIWGGPHHSLKPIQALKEKNIDIVVRGEGEETLFELSRAFQDNKELDNILGISFKKNGEIIHNPEREYLNMDDLPDLPWHLINFDDYYFSNLSSRNISLQTSRGCPYQCQFCINIRLNKNSWRAMSAEKIIEILIPLKEKYQIDGIVFWDDNFFVDFKRVEKFCQLLIKYKLNIKWEADCRVDYLAQMDDSFLKLLKSAGLSALFVGIESGSQRILDEVRKDITVEQIIKSAEVTAWHGFKVWYGFVIGFPEETKEDVLATVEIMKKVRKINPLANPTMKNFFPFPGTPLHDRAKKEGFVLPNNLAGWGDYRPEDTKTPWMRHKFSEYFPICLRFAVDYNRFSGLSKNPFLMFLVRILHYVEKFRWDYNFYYFPIELMVVKKIAKRLGLY